MLERRRHRRFRLALQGRLSSAGGEWLPVDVVNLSREAVLVRGPAPFHLLKRATVRLNLGPTPFEAEAVCVRVSQGPPHEGAFLFLDPPESAQGALETFLNDLPYPHSGRVL